MEAILSLLRAATAALAGLLVALGALVTSAPTSVINAPQATSTSPQQVYSGYADLPADKSAEVASSSLSKPPPKPVGTSTVPTTPTPPSVPTFSTDELNTLARASLVNIVCTTAAGGSFNPISGSGVIVDSRGIILTNAHVAQYFLLRDYPTKNNIECVVRVGSPAQPRYTAELMYLPQSWIDANAAKISSSTPSGTGQDDYAFLRITGTTNPNGTLPNSFPALPMEGADPSSGDQMLLAAYPAGFLGGISIALNLYITSAVATVGQLYDFSGDTVDLFSLGGTVVSQAGSSGGAAVNAHGKLQGIIVTEVPSATTAGRDLRALTLSHINRSLSSEGLGGITALLSGDPATIAANFQATSAPRETKALEDALAKQ